MKTLLLSLLFAVVPAASACGPAEFPPPETAAQTVEISAADATAAAVRRCVRDTGTRLAARDDDGCTVDTADAIRKLSPSATIRR